ncbi:Translocator [Beauveria bassiana]|nr:Translocator [Beauveria bassiana]
MTTYIPSLTLPIAAFQHTATSVLLPIAFGTAVGYSTKRNRQNRQDLGLNLAWMPLFFGARRPVEATADLVALLGLNGWLAYTWSAIDETAAWLQLPYLGWLAFATYLSAGAGYLNDWDMSDKALEARKKAE